ncbi:phage holin family protein [Micromonospora endolithica]|uniref:Phage holin family protein n=1 Tax=Micromonospora endolithica TaxID=230091 RepID=A0A3A9ZMU0_9ACTN|nr:phage holin family protein [Micromonospora endolithica]RKN49608.1 phage holin family protein [Micromonospora endolithica]TWJ23833.1 putative superfamily III holin-X [Micromonospora endolithica]
MTTPPPRGDGNDKAQNSIGQLLADTSRDLSTLLRQEVRLAKAELRQEARTAGSAAGIIVAAAIGALLTLLFLSNALWWGLSNVMDQGWAALLVAVLWAVVSGLLASRARRQLKTLRALPQTKQTAQEIPDALRGR